MGDDTFRRRVYQPSLPSSAQGSRFGSRERDSVATPWSHLLYVCTSFRFSSFRLFYTNNLQLLVSVTTVAKTLVERTVGTSAGLEVQAGGVGMCLETRQSRHGNW